MGVFLCRKNAHVFCRIPFPIAISGFKHLGQDKKRQFEILSEVILEIEALENDLQFKNVGANEKDDLRMARIARVFLGATGLIGTKIAQYLSASDQFKLSDGTRKVFSELTENARGIDKPGIFSMLQGLGESRIGIERILGAASIKTTFAVKADRMVYKIMNLPVKYYAQKDLEVLKNILADLQKQDLMSLQQRNQLERYIENMVLNESNFQLEAENARRQIERAHV